MFDIPIFFPDARKEKAIKSTGSVVQGEGGCCDIWSIIPGSSKPRKNVSYDKAKLAGLKFSSVPKQLVFPFPSVLLFVMGFFSPTPELNSRIYKTSQQPYMRYFLFYLDT